MESQQSGSTEDDWIVLLLLLCGVGGAGLFSIGTFLAPVQTWLLVHGILVAGSSALVHWGPRDVGLDLPRLAIGIAVVLLLAVLAGAALRRQGAKSRV